MKKQISDNQMARYWRRRVNELRGMRPMTSDEATEAAIALDAEADAIQAWLDGQADREAALRDTGRCDPRCYTIAQRDMDNAAAIGASRASNYGLPTRVLQLRGRAAAMRRVAAAPYGQPLSESLADAERRAEYYERLANSA